MKLYTKKTVVLIAAFAVLLSGTALIIGCNDEKPTDLPPVVIENQTPIAYPPFVVATSQTTRSPVTLDVRYRTQGCDASGNPTSVTGAIDRDGDSLEYRFTCEWSVFEKGADRKVNGQWVTFDTETNPNGISEQVSVVELWAGWTQDYPLMPISPAACNPVTEAVTFTYEVRDGHGAVASHTVLLGSP